MTAREQRDARLAAQLRENLKRRKVAARTASGEQPDSAAASPPLPD
ncbi:hypothetical protein [Sphingomonas sp.]|jgi:hypothetical protein|nr:hypothetical protein [Sphingomonas sp.]HEU0045667.1 hypothetical protein [Sphingomonas sp.]